MSDIDSMFSVSNENGDPDVDLDHRRLCSDGGCIGVLGPDGSCKECGRVGDDVTSDPRLRGFSVSQEDDDAPTDEEEAVQWEEQQEDDGTDDDRNGDDVSRAKNDLPSTFADRRLCPDGACIGVVGTDGSCPECGSVA